MADGFSANEIFFLMAIGILIMVALALAFVLFANFSQKKLLQEKNHRQELQIQHQQALLTGTLMAQEQERRRIAKDLHDEVGSNLNVLHLNLHRLKKTMGDRPESLGVFDEIGGLVADTIETTRRISHDLLPPTLESFGLQPAFKELAETYNRSGTVSIETDFSGQRRLPDSTTEINLFRIVQELISNSIRHGKAPNIRIGLDVQPGRVTLKYRDDGVGFNPGLVEKTGLGLKNLESRISMINGQWNIQSEPGKGVQVEIIVLLTDNEE